VTSVIVQHYRFASASSPRGNANKPRKRNLTKGLLRCDIYLPHVILRP
jgi:hypothetical protein